MKKFLVKISSIVAILVLGVLMILPSPQVEAASFNKNNLMSNSVFDDYNTMSTSQIQNFLNQFPNSCLKNHKARYPQDYFTYGSKVSAAKVIRRAATLWHINPRVILTTLEKEESLVSGNAGCANWRYNSAMGMGCPDGGSCPAPPYAGFSKQVTKGSWQLKFSKERAYGNTAWDGDGNVHYYGYMTRGNRAREAGGPSIFYDGHATIDGQDVYMSNGATAALYSYTPHFHGNQNFVAIFSRWFGSTTRSILFRISGSPTYYLEWSNYYYAISSPAVLRAYGLSDITPRIIGSAPSGETQGPSLTITAKFGSENSGDPDYTATINLVEGGKKHAAPNWLTLNAYGMSGYTVFPSSLGSVLSKGDPLTILARKPNGAIYLIQSNKKRIFPDWETFNTLSGQNSSGTIQTYSEQSRTNMSTNYINSIGNGAPMLLNGKTIKSSGQQTIYLYDNDKKYGFSADSYSAWGGRLNYKLNNASISQITSGGAAPLLITDGSNRYVVGNGKKYLFTTGVQSNWGLSAEQFDTVSSRALSRLSSDTATNLIRRSNGAVYIIKNSKKYLIPSMQDFSGLGYSWNDVINVSDKIVNSISDSNVLAFAPGSLVRTPNGAISWIGENYKSYTIPSLDSFNDFGFKWKNVQNLSGQALNGYSKQALKSLIESSGDKHYLANMGKLLSISDVAYGSSQYNLTSTPKTTLSDTQLNLLSRNGSLTQFIQGSGYTVYKVVNGQKRPFGSQEDFYANGGSWDKVTRVSDSFLGSLPTGSGY